MQENSKPQEASAEQLLKLMDAQLAALRQQREKTQQSKRPVIIVSLFVIIVGTAFALWMLLYALEQMRPEHAVDAPLEAKP